MKRQSCCGLCNENCDICGGMIPRDFFTKIEDVDDNGLPNFKKQCRSADDVPVETIPEVTSEITQPLSSEEKLSRESWKIWYETNIGGPAPDYYAHFSTVDWQQWYYEYFVKPQASAIAVINEYHMQPQQPAFLFNEVYVGNLDPETTEAQLYNIFSGCIGLTGARIVKNKHNKSRGFGFVVFRSIHDASQAILYMNGKLLNTRNMQLKLAEHSQGQTLDKKVFKKKKQKKKPTWRK